MSKLLPADEQVKMCAASRKCQCGAQATRKIEEVLTHHKEFNDDGSPTWELNRHPYTSYICEDCFAAIMGWRGFAAGPWKDIKEYPAPEGEYMLVKVKAGWVMVARNDVYDEVGWPYGWSCNPDDEGQFDPREIAKWASLNWGEKDDDE